MLRLGQNLRRWECEAGGPLSGTLGPGVVARGVQVGSGVRVSSGAGLGSGQDGFVSLVRFDLGASGISCGTWGLSLQSLGFSRGRHSGSAVCSLTAPCPVGSQFSNQRRSLRPLQCSVHH